MTIEAKEEEDNDEEDDHDDHTIILNPKPMLELSSLESGRVERRGCNINSYYIIKHHQGKKNKCFSAFQGKNQLICIVHMSICHDIRLTC